jgi:hypothetical protein
MKFFKTSPDLCVKKWKVLHQQKKTKIKYFTYPDWTVQFLNKFFKIRFVSFFCLTNAHSPSLFCRGYFESLSTSITVSRNLCNASHSICNEFNDNFNSGFLAFDTFRRIAICSVL